MAAGGLQPRAPSLLAGLAGCCDFAPGFRHGRGKEAQLQGVEVCARWGLMHQRDTNQQQNDLQRLAQRVLQAKT